MAPNQEPVGIDAIGGAGHEGTQILALLNEQGLGVLWLHDQNLVYLIGQHLIQHAQPEPIPHHQPIQVGEKSGTGQAPVAGQDAVGALPAHGQARPLQVPHSHLQNRILGAVVNGQGHIQAGDFDVAHNAHAGHVQQPLIFRLLVVVQKVGVFPAHQGAVIGLGLLPKLTVAILVQLGHLLGIVGDGTGLVRLVPPVGEGGVQHQGQPYDQYEDQKNCRGVFAHRALLAAALCHRRGNPFGDRAENRN